MQKIFSIAIDGPAGAGKSTVAKALARELGAMYLDTGAMYRAFGLAMLRAGVDVNSMSAVAARADDVDITVEYVDGVQHISLAGEDVTTAIREPAVSGAASSVSAVPEVRARMVALQRRIAEGHSVVMDGRDIGTVVLPDAQVKIYLTAGVEVRAMRRYKEYLEKGEPADLAAIEEQIRERDWRDMHRDISPLRKADDAVEVDSSDLNIEETLEKILAIVEEKISGMN